MSVLISTIRVRIHNNSCPGHDVPHIVGHGFGLTVHWFGRILIDVVSVSSNLGFFCDGWPLFQILTPIFLSWDRTRILFAVLFFTPSFGLLQFLLKTDSGYPKDTGVTLKTLTTTGNLLRYNTPRSVPSVSALAHSRGLGARQAEGL